MNRSDEALFDPRVADWLEDDPHAAPDQALDVVLAAFPSIKQRRAVRVPWRFNRMSSPLKLAFAVAAIAVVVGGVLMFGPWLRPIPNTGATSPSPGSSGIVATSSPTLPPVTGLPGAFALRVDDGESKDLVVMNPDRTGRVQVTTDKRLDTGPVLSRDGTRIAFQRTDPIASNSEIWVVNADGSDETQLTMNAQYEDWPGWSGDGTSVVFARAYSNAGRNFSEIVIRTVASAGELDPGAAENVVFRRDVADGFVDLKPAWSPDGSKIAFTSDMDGPYRLYTIKPDGSRFTKVSDVPASGRPAWSPDSKTLAYAEDRLDGCVWLIEASGEGSRAIAGDQCTGGPVAWSPDGTMIGWAGGERSAPISVVNVDGSNLRQLTADSVYGDLSWGPAVP